MKVADLKDRSKVDVLELDVLSKGEARPFSSRNGSGHVCDARARDDSGEVTLTLWNDEIERVAAGNRVRITNGWVSSFRGDLKVSAGRFGKLEVV